MVLGTTPPWRSVIAFAAPTIDFVLLRKNPVDLMIVSTSPGFANAKLAGVGKRANNPGVTRFTVRSVLWALRIVATNSCHGSVKSSSVFASGYAFLRRRT